MTDTYAGDITPQEAWDKLTNDKEAVLIDVRTEAEWAWVGQADLSSLGKQHFNVEWIRFPGGVPNEGFVSDVEAVLPQKDIPVLLLCRSGVRSKHAAIALTACGYQTCFNVAGGFEGDKNDDEHRGTINGWKVAGLPWKQG
ncbi:rhodanese-like domain-containing protein [Terasakiella sp. A23]|uniref:rhodanese-like domain-containing protein n=1 Tax=Terasakiella sp. FCG-A23 TaxID=3080561 RepID=UPI0029531D0B|nr:rhodanese-like domain-containing protein [Terasakiella sp. A23]MDV7340442.1 rhodanese-like domain-containing protein [Terasakiella sp. A23]